MSWRLWLLLAAILDVHVELLGNGVLLHRGRMVGRLVYFEPELAEEVREKVEIVLARPNTRCYS